MTRILLSTATVALVAFGACLLLGRQECAAVSNSLASAPADLPEVASEININLIKAAPHIDADVDLAQVESPFPGEPPSLRGSATASSRRVIKVPKTQTVYEDRVVEMAEVTPLQQQYSVLMLKRAQRMSEDELTKAIEELEAELKQQDEAADAELQKAVEILNELQENSGGTPAARRAAEALPVLKGIKPAKTSSPAPTYSDPSASAFQPAPPLNPLPTY